MTSWGWTAAAALALLSLVACNNEDDEPKILPIHASVDVATVTDNQAIFLAESPLDTKTDDDIAVVDVMMRLSPAQEFDAFTLRLRFDPSVVQLGAYTQAPETDGQMCNSSSTYCGKYPAPDPLDPTPPPPTTGPICLPLSAGEANATGDQLISFAARAGTLCDSFPLDGTIRVMSLTFFAASVGTSAIQLVTEEANDCEILNGLSALPGVTCLDGGATVTASR
jgi:hypothetical protein